MTDYFVSNNPAGDDSDGLTKATAFLTFEQLDGIATAGDTIFMSHAHSEVGSTTVNYSMTGTPQLPIQVVSIDYSDDSITAGGGWDLSGTAADVTFSGRWVDYYGILAKSSDDIQFSSTGSQLRFFNCTLGSSRFSSSVVILLGGGLAGFTYFEKCVFDWVHSSSSLRYAANAFGAVRIVDCSVLAPMTSFIDVQSASKGSQIDVLDSDLTNATNPIAVASSNSSGVVRATFTRVKLSSWPPSVLGEASLVNIPDARIEFNMCDVGTITAAAYKWAHFDKFGSSFTTTDRYRTGGADDGEQVNGFSQEITARANDATIRINPTRIRLGIFNVANGVSTEFKVHLAHDAVGAGTAGALQTDQFWISLGGPSEKGTSDAQGEFITNQLDPFAAASDLPLEAGETWNGTNLGTKQSDSISYTPEMEGWVEVWANFAPGGASDVVVNVDLKIEVS